MSSPLTTHAQVVSRLAGTAFDRSAVYISDDQAFDLLAVLQTHFGKLAEDCQLKNASSTPSSGKSTPPFTDASSETSSSSQSSIYACEDKEPDSTLEKAFIDEFSCAYSMADLDWLKNLGDQMYLDPIQSLLDAAFESPIFFTEEAVDFSAGVSYYGVRCDKPPADVPVDCRASSIFCDSSLLEPISDEQRIEDVDYYIHFYSPESSDAESVCPVTRDTVCERRQVPKVAREPIGPKPYTVSVLKAFARGLFGKKPSGPSPEGDGKLSPQI